jgi:phosphopantothenoylcysteine synthetase/decarboxylase
VKVLITAGGTEEAIDGVRRLTNTSTGATGGALARAFAAHGATVTLLHGVRAPLASLDLERLTFTDFTDLEGRLHTLLAERDFDAVVHLAAVADYRIAAVEIDGQRVPHGGGGKIPGGHEMVVRLAPTPKLVDQLRRWSRNPSITVVGFKLTDTSDGEERRAQVRALLERETTDLVVHNDLSEIAGDRHPAEIWAGDRVVARTETKRQLAETLFDLLAARPESAGPVDEELRR